MPEPGAVPEYWEEAKASLGRADSILAEVLASREQLVLTSRGDMFLTLTSSIVSQQISTKAAKSVWSRVESLVGEVTPQSILSHTHEELRGCGLSGRKAEYIHGIAEAWTNGYEDIRLEDLRDEGASEVLVALRGVGTWTAALLLIFALLRPDVSPIGALGGVRAMEGLYNVRGGMSPEALVGRAAPASYTHPTPPTIHPV